MLHSSSYNGFSQMAESVLLQVINFSEEIDFATSSSGHLLKSTPHWQLLSLTINPSLLLPSFSSFLPFFLSPELTVTSRRSLHAHTHSYVPLSYYPTSCSCLPLPIETPSIHLSTQFSSLCCHFACLGFPDLIFDRTWIIQTNTATKTTDHSNPSLCQITIRSLHAP